jgi:ribA/ribD-fused uncharacterized protein
MDEYLQNLEIFYDQKMKYLSNKEKYVMCNNCDDKKEFEEGKDKLILSCGSDKGECGPQIIIKLPKYIHYETKMDELKAEIENEYNWEKLQNYLNVGENLAESKRHTKIINEEITRIESMFFKKNMEMKQKELQSFYDQRIRKTRKCKEIEKELQKPELPKQQKKEFTQEYIRNVQEMNTEYGEIKELMKDINPFLTEEEPEVIIKHENYEYRKETKKKKKGNKRVGSSDISKKFEVSMRVSWIYNDTKKYGTIKEIKGQGALVEDANGKERIRMFKKLMIEGKEEGKEEEEEEEEDIEIDSDEEEEEAINYFSKSKDNKWLSTFNRGEPFNYDGLLYPTVEHAFHAQKVDDEKKEEYQELFTNDAIDPSEAKKLGGKKNFELNEFSLRKDWDNVKLEKMKEITMEYYAANPQLVEKLRKTGSKKLLHSGFRIDNYWGIKKNGEGENNHGKILMKIRDTI